MKKLLYSFFQAEIKEEVKKALLEIGRENVQEKLQLGNFIYRNLGEKESPSSKDFECLVPYFSFPIYKIQFDFTVHVKTEFGIETLEVKFEGENFAEVYKRLETLAENPQSCYTGSGRIEGISKIKLYLWYRSLGENKIQTYYIDGVSSENVFYLSDFSRICKMILGKLDQYPEMLL